MVTRHGTRSYLWAVGDLRYKLDNLQRNMVQTMRESIEDEILILSSRQIGKSYATICFALECAIQTPGVIIRVMSATLKQVNDIVADNLDPIIADAPPGFVRPMRSERRWLLHNGSEIRLGALERAHVDANRGGNAYLVVAEEGGFINSEDYRYAIQSVIGPQLLHSSKIPGGGRLIHVSSPSVDEPDHLLHVDILPKCDMMGTAFRYTIDDSPRVTPDMRAKAVKRCGGEETIAWQVEYMARIVRNPESVVIPTFNRSAHVKQVVLPEYFVPQIAIDWGGVRDKTVALLHTYDFRRNKKLWLAERVFGPNTPTDRIITDILDMERGLEGIVRYADVPGQLQIDLAAAGYEVQLPVKDDWKAGINALQVSIGNGEHEIDESCKFLIQSLESGRYNKSRTDFHRNEILGHCDAIAAMGYGNRMMSEANPYPYIQPHRDLYFAPPKPPSEIEKAAAAIVPKTFANTFESSYFTVKKFGAFK